MEYILFLSNFKASAENHMIRQIQVSHATKCGQSLFVRLEPNIHGFLKFFHPMLCNYKAILYFDLDTSRSPTRCRLISFMGTRSRPLKRTLELGA